MMIGNVYELRAAENEVEVEWKIENFLSRLKSRWTNRSPTFTWSSTKWELEMVYNSSEGIRLYLFKCTSGEPQAVVFKLGIRLIDGAVETRCYLIKTYEDRTSGFGTEEFILTQELIERKYELLVEGVLTITCSVGCLDNVTKPQNVKYECLDVLSSNLKALYGCNKSSDVTIIVKGEIYPAHKNILTARSDVFTAMFEHEMKEKTCGIINVADCDPNSFKDFLLYLYTGKVDISSTNFCHLYKTADKYNVKDLKTLCIKYMIRNMSIANLFDIIILANQFNNSELMSIAQEYFNRNSLEIVRADAWEQFLKENFAVANQLLIRMLEKMTTKDSRNNFLN